MYLPHDATEASLEMMAALSANGSRVVLTYMIPKLYGTDGGDRWTRLVFGLIDEPLIGGMTPARLKTMARKHSFSVISDGSNSDWAQQLGERGAPWAMLFRPERMAMLERQRDRTDD